MIHMKLNDIDAYKLLEKYEIPVAKHGLARNIAEAEIILENMNCPVYMKIDSPDIVHKRQAGCVRILYNQKDLHDTFRSLMNNARQVADDINGVIIQELVSGYEAIIGAKFDEQFGYVVMFGTDGPMTEIINDVSFRMIPFTRYDLRTMMEETRIFQLLQKERVETEDIVQIMINLARLAEKEQIKELDINPLFVSRHRIVVADVRIVK